MRTGRGDGETGGWSDAGTRGRGDAGMFANGRLAAYGLRLTAHAV